MFLTSRRRALAAARAEFHSCLADWSAQVQAQAGRGKLEVASLLQLGLSAGIIIIVTATNAIVISEY